METVAPAFMPVNIDVSPEAANRPGFGRFARTGRIIPPDYLDQVGKMPSLTCHASKPKEAADGHAQIDNSAFGRPRIVTDRAGENAVRDPRYDVSPGRERQPGSDPGAAGLDGSTKGPARDRLAPAGGKKPIVCEVMARDPPIRAQGRAATWKRWRSTCPTAQAAAPIWPMIWCSAQRRG